MGKIENYASLDETVRCEFEQLWEMGESYVNDDDVIQITGLVNERGLSKGYYLETTVIGNGLSIMRIESSPNNVLVSYR